MGSCCFSFSSLVVCIVLLISIPSFPFDSHLTCVAWNLENHEENTVAEPPEANAIAADDFGILENGHTRNVEKVSGEHNVDGEVKVMILEKFRFLFGLQSSTKRSQTSGAANARQGLSPAPAPIHTNHFHHHSLHHHSLLPHSALIPPLQDGQTQRKNGSIAKTGRIVIASVASFGATLLIIGFTVALLFYRSRRNRKKKLVCDGFDVSKTVETTIVQRKVTPSPTQELFYSKSLETIQEEHDLTDNTPNVSENARNLTSSKRWRNYGLEGISYDAEEFLQEHSPPLDKNDDSSESFHSICNSGCSTARSSDASENNLCLQSQVCSPCRFSKRLLSSPTKPPTLQRTPEVASPSHSVQNLHEITGNYQTLHSTPDEYRDSKTSTRLHYPLVPSTLRNGTIPQPPRPPPLPQLALLPTFRKEINGTKTQIPLPLPQIFPPQFKPRCDSIRPPSPPPPPPPLKTVPCENQTHSSRFPPCSLPVPVPVGKDGSTLPKLKPLHWDKVRAAPDRSMVWDKIRFNSFELDEEMIESLFSYNAHGSSKAEEAKSKTPSPSNHVLEPKRLQNFTILLKALNATTEQVHNALIKGTGLSAQQLEALAKIAPTKEEEENLRNYKGNINELGPAERFVKLILSVPHSFQKIEVMLYRETFEDEVAHLRSSFQMIEEACKELQSSKLFLRLLEAVLKTGNRMNVGTIRGGARAFKLDALLKLADVKGTDGKTTLLHFVVQEVIRLEGISSTEMIPQKEKKTKQLKRTEQKEDNYRLKGLQLLSGLSNELCNVKKTAGIDLEVLTKTVSNLSIGMETMKQLIQEDLQKEDGSASFVDQMKSFLDQAKAVISELKDEEDKVLLHVREVTEYFHGDVSRDEANPLRIFVIVRDFLAILDRVCKELGSSKNTVVSTG